MTHSFTKSDPYVIVLGVAQDAGHPQAGCVQSCCEQAWSDPSKGHRITSLGLVDPQTDGTWLLDASPDLPRQWATLNTVSQHPKNKPLDGILLTHAHFGHYTGLMFLGRESAGAHRVPVYAMKRMEAFLSTHGPWEQLVTRHHIEIKRLRHQQSVQLNDRLWATPILVPHRDEYSETVGFHIDGPNRSILYLPDVDKWERMKTPIENLIERVDIAFVDGTFYTDAELPGRAMSEIPHPFMTESLKRFAALPTCERNKIHFIHFNHTNPVLQPDSARVAEVKELGMHVAMESQLFGL